MTRSPHTRRPRLVLLKGVVSVSLLGLLLSRADLGTLAASFRHADLRWMLVALALYGLMVLLSAWRWRLLLDAIPAPISTARLSESYLVAIFLSNFLPSNIGGDVVRITDTAPYVGSRTVATTVIVVDRTIGLVALFSIAAVASLLALRVGAAVPGAAYIWLVLGATVGLCLPVLLAPRAVSAGLPRLALSSQWLGDRLARLAGTLERLRADPKRMSLAFLGAIAVQAALVAF